jgi:toxin ParE1/3/4
VRPPFIGLRDQAINEVDEIARYIARDNVDAGRRFYDQLQSALKMLAEMPGLGRMWEPKPAGRLAGLRTWPIKRFDNYLIFYLPRTTGGIEVLHVLHGARDVQRLLDRDD